MSSAISWLLVCSLVVAGWVFTYALCRVAGRCSREEDEIVRRTHRLDNGLLAQAMRRQERAMGDEGSHPAEVLPGEGVAR